MNNYSERVGNFEYRQWGQYPDQEEKKRQAVAIKAQYPVDPDTSIGQILLYLEKSHGHEVIDCSERGELRGLVGYSEVIEESSPFLFIHNLAVLPKYQRQGIGTALLEYVKDLARGRVPIIVRNVNDVAIPRLIEVGFWEIPGFKRNRRFKWTDLHEHQNNASPWPDDCD